MLNNEMLEGGVMPRRRMPPLVRMLKELTAGIESNWDTASKSVDLLSGELAEDSSGPSLTRELSEQSKKLIDSSAAYAITGLATSIVERAVAEDVFFMPLKTKVLVVKQSFDSEKLLHLGFPQPSILGLVLRGTRKGLDYATGAYAVTPLAVRRAIIQPAGNGEGLPTIPAATEEVGDLLSSLQAFATAPTITETR